MDDKHILTYDDIPALAEAGQQIIDLIQEGCKSSNSGRNTVLIPAIRDLEESNSYDSDPRYKKSGNLSKKISHLCCQ